MIAQSFGRRVARHPVSLMALALFAVNAQALPFLILKAVAPNATVLEGERGGVPVTLDYTVSLSAVSVVPVTVLFATQPQTSPSFPAVNGTSCPSSDAGRVQPQADFVAKSVQLVIPANTLQFPGTVSVAICPDDQVEPAEKLIVLLTSSDPSVAVCFSECQSIATIVKLTEYTGSAMIGLIT